MTDVHAPGLASGVRWNDPAFGIQWPEAGTIVISERDAGWPDFERREFAALLARRGATPAGEALWT
jgi:dTDP-4-dehydrorhamnose 3,5-epimerase